MIQSAFLALERFFHAGFTWIMMGALALGVFVPAVSDFFHPLIFATLVVVMFFNFLKIEDAVLVAELKDVRYQSYLAGFTLLLLPAAVVGLAWLASPLLGIGKSDLAGLLLFTAAPTAAIAPTLAILYGARIERAMLNLVLTSLLIPVTLPFLFWALLGGQIHVDYGMMAFRLAMLVVLPFTLARVYRKVHPSGAARLKPHAPFFAMFFLTFLTLGGVAGVRAPLMENPWHALKVGLIVLGVMALCFAVGFLLSFRKGLENRLTLAIVSTWTNISLAMVIAVAMFKQTQPEIVLFLALSYLPWNMSFVPAKWVVGRLMERAKT